MMAPVERRWRVEGDRNRASRKCTAARLERHRDRSHNSIVCDVAERPNRSGCPADGVPV